MEKPQENTISVRFGAVLAFFEACGFLMIWHYGIYAFINYLFQLKAIILVVFMFAMLFGGTYVLVLIYNKMYRLPERRLFNYGLVTGFFYLIIVVGGSVNIMEYGSVQSIVFQMCGIIGLISFGIRTQFYDYSQTK